MRVFCCLDLLLLLLVLPLMQPLSVVQNTWLQEIGTRLQEASELRVFCDSSATKCVNDPNSWNAQAGILLIPIEANRGSKLQCIAQSIRDRSDGIFDLQKGIQQKSSKLKALDLEISTKYAYEIRDRQCYDLECEASQHLKLYYGDYLEKRTSTESRNSMRSLEKIVNTKVNTDLNDVHNVQVIDKLARMCYDHGRYKEGAKYFELAIQRWERILGTTHPRTLSSICAMAALMERDGQVFRAKQMYNTVLDGYVAHFGENHALTKRVKASLVTIAQMDDDSSDNERIDQLENTVENNEIEEQREDIQKMKRKGLPEGLKKNLQKMHKINLNIDQKKRKLHTMKKEKERLLREQQNIKKCHHITDGFVLSIDDIGSKISSSYDAEVLALEAALIMTLNAVQNLDTPSTLSEINFYMDNKAARKAIIKTRRGESIMTMESILARINHKSRSKSDDKKLQYINLQWCPGHPEVRKPNHQSWSLNDYGMYICDLIARQSCMTQEEAILVCRNNNDNISSPFFIDNLHVLSMPMSQCVINSSL